MGEFDQMYEQARWWIDWETDYYSGCSEYKQVWIDLPYRLMDLFEISCYMRGVQPEDDMEEQFEAMRSPPSELAPDPMPDPLRDIMSEGRYRVRCNRIYNEAPEKYRHDVRRELFLKLSLWEKFRSVCCQGDKDIFDEIKLYMKARIGVDPTLEDHWDDSEPKDPLVYSIEV